MSAPNTPADDAREVASEEISKAASGEPKPGVTTRDRYIIGQALLYAIAHIQRLPWEKQEGSNMIDMLAIAKATFSPSFIAFQRQNVFNRTGVMIDMDPE